MKSHDQAENGAPGMQVDDMRTVSALRGSTPVEDAAARLPDRQLRAAAKNPDHSEAGRAMAAEVMRARGLSDEPWSPVLRSFIKPRQLERGDAHFFGFAARLRRMLGLIAVAGLIALIALLWLRAGNAMAGVAALGAAGAALGWCGLSIFRRKVARVGVIRPARQTHGALRRFIRRELRCYGHVVTLAPGADAGAVRSAAGYRAAAARLRHRFTLNVRALLSDREALTLSADDPWRPYVLDLLVRSCDALIVDLSEGGSWAWADLQHHHAPERCVFVAAWAQLEAAEAALRAANVQAPCFAYAPDGEIQRRAQFRSALLAAMRAAHGMEA